MTRRRTRPWPRCRTGSGRCWRSCGTWRTASTRPCCRTEGLAAALGGRGRAAPVAGPGNRSGHAGRHAVEATAYFVACEALGECRKARQGGPRNRYSERAESRLNLQIADDGVGGVESRGHGLSNIVDRVNALDGEVTIVSPPGQRNTPGGENSMRLAIAEDSGLFRSSLTLLLEASGAEVTASTASGAELLAAIPADLPDAVILDIRMPPSFTDEGISTAAELRRRYPDVGILVLSTYAETSYASELLETVPTGVGYLLKDNVTDAGTLMDSLARVADGETVIDPTIVRRLLQTEPEAEQDRRAEPARAQVLRHMAEGRSNLGIAKELFLSARTVEAHVTSIFLKLGLDQADTENNRVRAVLAFLRSADAGN